MGIYLSTHNYMPYIDVCVVALSVIYAWLLGSAYNVKRQNLILFRIANCSVLGAAFTKAVYHFLINNINERLVSWIYILRDISYLLLAVTLMCFCVYIGNLVDITAGKKRLMLWTGCVVWLLYGVWECLTPVTKLGFYIDDTLQVHEPDILQGFLVVYGYFIILLLVMLIRHKQKFISSMYNCIIKVVALCVCIMGAQLYFGQTGFTCITFSLPIMAVLFLFHSNSYDPDTGTLNAKSFGLYISDLKNREFTMICIRLEDMKQDSLTDFSNEFFRFNEKYFKDSCIFSFGNDKLIMIYEKAKNLKAVFTMPILMEKFYELYEKFHMDYKIVTIHSSPELKSGDDYLALNDFLERRVKMNTSYECTHDDVVAFLNANYIVQQLHDIVLCNNLDDERVLVFCQPIYNTKTKSFTTAEALMRLKLENTGVVFPDVFIPLAEKFDFIHFLSMVILNKVCKKVKTLMDKGYVIDRISVNFAMSELRDANFCDEVKQIVEANGIPFDKIALELTESMNEAEFGHVQTVMKTLHEVGMKFYLDDFGTGYSNFERIMKLPIDIIKFDRSLTIVAVNDESSRDMVVGFTDIFRRADYKILFEGVEDELDEKQCIEMSALYLQGYKYSRPIPIDELDDFLDKEEKKKECEAQGESECACGEEA